MLPEIDPRLRRAIDASIGWYEDITALHGIHTRLEDGVWSSVGPPPPLHSAVVAVEPWVSVEQIEAALEGRDGWGYKDSFATLAPARPAELLFAATWMHLDPAPASDRRRRSPWHRVRDPQDLARWNAGHDTAEVLLPGLLERGHFAVLARIDGGEIEAGAVARLGSGAVDLSNVHAADGATVDWAELSDVVGRVFPGRPIVGYERGDDLEAALAGGFEPIGDLRVWVG
jgi:hypothetical protein